MRSTLLGCPDRKPLKTCDFSSIRELRVGVSGLLPEARFP